MTSDERRRRRVLVVGDVFTLGCPVVATFMNAPRGLLEVLWGAAIFRLGFLLSDLCIGGS